MDALRELTLALDSELGDGELVEFIEESARRAVDAHYGQWPIERYGP